VLRSIHVLMLSKCACLHVYYWWYLVLSLLRTFPVILYSRVYLVINVAIIPLWLSHMRVHTGLTFRYTPDFHFPAKRHTRTHARRISRWCSGVGPGPHIFSSHFTTQVFFWMDRLFLLYFVLIPYLSPHPSSKFSCTCLVTQLSVVLLLAVFR